MVLAVRAPVVTAPRMGRINAAGEALEDSLTEMRDWADQLGDGVAEAVEDWAQEALDALDVTFELGEDVWDATAEIWNDFANEVVIEFNETFNLDGAPLTGTGIGIAVGAGAIDSALVGAAAGLAMRGIVAVHAGALVGLAGAAENFRDGGRHAISPKVWGRLSA